MKMKCEVVKDLIPMYTDKTASYETELEVGAHLESCPECRAYYEGCKRIEAREKHGFEMIEGYVNKNCGSEISNLDREFALFSGKLKKRRTRQNIIAALLLVGMIVYVVLDIIKTRSKGR